MTMDPHTNMLIFGEVEFSAQDDGYQDPDRYTRKQGECHRGFQLGKVPSMGPQSSSILDWDFP